VAHVSVFVSGALLLCCINIFSVLVFL